MDSLDVYSSAPLLEPIAGTAFALNLVYIGLERFRYRAKIREDALAKDKLLETDGPSFPSALKDLDVYKQLKALCGLPNNAQKENPKAAAARMPSGAWGFVYHWVFSRHWDRRLSISAAVLCAFVLSSGCAHQLDHWGWTRYLFSRDGGVLWFYLILLSGAVPVILAVSGIWVVREAQGHSKNCVTQIEVYLKAQVSQVEVRTTSNVTDGPPMDADIILKVRKGVRKVTNVGSVRYQRRPYDDGPDYEA